MPDVARRTLGSSERQQIMPKKPLPPAVAGTTPRILAPSASKAPDRTLAKAPKPGFLHAPGFVLRGKSANQLIHAQKPRGR